MNWASLLKAIPALLALVGRLFGDRKNPPKRASEILGGANTPTKSKKAKDAADAAADTKYGK